MSVRLTLVGGFAVLADSLYIVRGHSFAAPINEAEVVLRHSVALFGSFSAPALRLLNRSAAQGITSNDSGQLLLFGYHVAGLQFSLQHTSVRSLESVRALGTIFLHQSRRRSGSCSRVRAALLIMH
jgi:hypothetical protein